VAAVREQPLILNGPAYGADQTFAQEHCPTRRTHRMLRHLPGCPRPDQGAPDRRSPPLHDRGAGRLDCRSRSSADLLTLGAHPLVQGGPGQASATARPGYATAHEESSPRAMTAVYVASAPALAKVSGLFFTRSKPKRSSPRSYDTAMAARLWRVSAQLTGVLRPDAPACRIQLRCWDPYEAGLPRRRFACRERA